jgi:TP901 family phage tail tape measure protein
VALSVGEVEATLKLRDEMSAAAQNIANRMQRMFVEQARAAEQANERIKAAAVASARAQEAAVQRAAEATAKAAQKMAADQVRAAKRAEEAWNNLGPAMSSVGTRMTAMVTLPIVAFLGGAMKAAMDFETAMSKVRKVLGGAEVDAAGLDKAIREMAKSMPTSTDELARIAAMAGQMGVKAPEVAEFTRQIAMLGVALSDVTTEEAAASLAKIGEVSQDGTSKVAAYASTLIALGNASNSTEGQILEFSQRLIGAGASIGLTVDQVMALGSAMASVGINAELGGTAMSTVMVKMAEAVTKGGQKLDAFAHAAQVSAETFATAFRTEPIQAIQMFIDGLHKSGEEGVEPLIKALGELGVEGARMRMTLLNLAKSGDALNNALVVASQAFKDQNAHLKSYEERASTAANQLKMLWNNVKDVGVTIGGPMISALKDAVKAAIPFVQHLGALAQLFDDMPGFVKLGAFALLGLVAAGGPMILLIGKTIEAAREINLLRKALLGLAAADVVTGLSGAASGVGGISRVLGSIMPFLMQIVRFGGIPAMLGLGVYTAYSGFMTDMEKQQAEFERRMKNATPIPGYKPPSDLGPWKPTTSSAITLKDAQAGTAVAAQNVQIKGLTGVFVDATAAAAAFDKQQERVAKSTGATVNSQQALAAALKQYQSDMASLAKKGGVDAVLKLHTDYGKALDDLATEYGVHESSLQRALDLYRQTAKDVKETGKPLEALKDDVTKLNAALALGASKLTDAEFADEFGTEIDKARLAIKRLGDEAPKATDDLITSMARLDKFRLSEFMKDGTAFAADELERLTKVANEAAQRHSKEASQAMLTNLQLQGSALEDMLKIAEDREDDSLEKRLRAVRRDYDKRRSEIQKHGDFSTEALDALNKAEKDAVEDVTRRWKERFGQTKEQVAKMAKAAMDGFEEMRDSGLYTADQVAAAWEDAWDQMFRQNHQGLIRWLGTLGKLADQFEQLSQIAGGAFSDVTRWIGTVIKSTEMAGQASIDWQYAMDSFKAGQTAQGFQGLATSIAGVGGAFMQATASGHMLGDVLGGMAVGAQFGAQFGPIGAAVGAAIGGIAGAVRNIFGGPSKAQLEGREMAEAFGDGLLKGLNSRQMREVREAVEGAWKGNARGAATVIALRDAYLAMGRTGEEALRDADRLWRRSSG